MKYILFYNIDELSKNIFLKSYIDDGYKILEEKEGNILIKKDSNNLLDEEIYIKILYSFLKRNSAIKEHKGKIIDLTKAFEYAYRKGKYNKFDNKFDWYIRNIIIKELNSD